MPSARTKLSEAEFAVIWNAEEENIEVNGGHFLVHSPVNIL